MLNFTFEEIQLIGNLTTGTADQETINKDFIINRLSNAISNTDDTELANIGKVTLNKLNCLDKEALKELIDSISIEDNE